MSISFLTHWGDAAKAFNFFPSLCVYWTFDHVVEVGFSWLIWSVEMIWIGKDKE